MIKLTYGMDSHKNTEFIRYFKTWEDANEFIAERELLKYGIQETDEGRQRKKA